MKRESETVIRGKAEPWETGGSARCSGLEGQEAPTGDLSSGFAAGTLWLRGQSLAEGQGAVPSA